MSQSRASLINTTLSLMVVDATAMPPNLGHTQKEDYPESLFRVVAYDGKNILPTALGYRSHFSDTSHFAIPPAPSQYLQAILVYQGADYAVRMIALAEEGAWIINATEGQADNAWTQIMSSGNDPATLVRHQWTWAVVANQLYIYQQGEPNFYCICTPDYFTNNVNQTIIPGATVAAVLQNGGFGILRITPTFLNMAGQVGIFRADTRLGFWDSSDSVSWSSVTQVYDFTPSTTTFAGITKFADVVGKISIILGQGDGFIIYAARSIVRVTGTGSNEVWAGTALLSDAGIAFDSQACASQPDDTHYAITGSGLYQITGGQVQPIEPEVSDYLVENALVYSCHVIDARYLFLHSDKDLVPSYYDVSLLVGDIDGNQYEFKPTVPDAGQTGDSLIIGAIQGQANGIHGDFSYSAKPVDQPPAVNAIGSATIPCYTGKTFSTNFDESVLPSGQSSDMTTIPFSIASSIDPSHSYDLDIRIFKPRFTVYNYDVDEDFIDQAGQDFQTVVDDTFELVKTCQKIKKDGSDLFTSTAEYQRKVDHFELVTPRPIGDTATTYLADDPTLRWTWRDLMSGSDGLATKTSCKLEIQGQKVDIKFKFDLTMTEVVAPYYSIFKATQGGDLHIAYCGTEAAYLAGGYADIGIPTPNVAAAKYLFVYGGDIPNGDTAIVPANAEAVVVISALYEGSYQIGSMVRTGTPRKQYMGTVGRGTQSPVAGDCFGVGFHQACGGSMATSYVHYTATVAPTVNECGATTTVSDPTYDAVPGLAGQLFMGACQGASRDLVGKLDGDGSTCIPDAQVKAASNNYIYVTGLGYDDLALILAPNDIPFTDPTIVAAFNMLKKTIRLNTLDFAMTPIQTLQADKTQILEGEISGYGYQPSGGFSFRKTHTRASGSPCIGDTGSVTVPIDPENSAVGSTPIDTTSPGGSSKPAVPGKWNYPQPVPRGAYSALFQVGTPAPFYPNYHSAIIYDLHYKKWGRYSNEHQVVYGTLPSNRVDHTVVPVVDKGIRGGAFRASDRSCSFFMPDNANSMICYGKIGKSREGVTQSTKIVAQFAKPANGNIIVEMSRDGVTVDTTSSLYIPLEDALSVTFPFTETAKWFNIRLEGQFDLTYLEFESAATGRR